MQNLAMAEKVGFEPTVPFLVHSISSRGRYNHFDTSPNIFFSSEKGVKIFGNSFWELQN